MRGADPLRWTNFKKPAQSNSTVIAQMGDAKQIMSVPAGTNRVLAI